MKKRILFLMVISGSFAPLAYAAIQPGGLMQQTVEAPARAGEVATPNYAAARCDGEKLLQAMNAEEAAQQAGTAGRAN